jgi:hypothetical protein
MSKKVKGLVSFKKSGAVLGQKHEIEINVSYPWNGGSMQSAFIDALENSDKCPDGHSVYSVTDLKEIK